MGDTLSLGVSILACLSQFCPSVYTSTYTHLCVQMCASAIKFLCHCVCLRFDTGVRAHGHSLRSKIPRANAFAPTASHTKTHLCGSP